MRSFIIIKLPLIYSQIYLYKHSVKFSRISQVVVQKTLVYNSALICEIFPTNKTSEPLKSVEFYWDAWLSRSPKTLNTNFEPTRVEISRQKNEIDFYKWNYSSHPEERRFIGSSSTLKVMWTSWNTFSLRYQLPLCRSHQSTHSYQYD